MYSKYLVAALVLLVTIMLEIFLILLYAALFVNEPEFSRYPLGLPPATARVFLIITIVLVIVLFAIVPDQWGANKAVVLLFGLFSTVVGFYFGNRAGASDDSESGTVRLTLKDESKTVKASAAMTRLTGKLDGTYKSRLGGSTMLSVVLLNSNGTPTSAQTSAHIDSDGQLTFEFSNADLTADKTYVLHVISPNAVVCDDRITVIA